MVGQYFGDQRCIPLNGRAWPRQKGPTMATAGASPAPEAKTVSGRPRRTKAYGTKDASTMSRPCFPPGDPRAVLVWVPCVGRARCEMGF